MLCRGSCDKTVKVWDAASGALLQTLEGHNGYVRSVCYSPCGRTLCSGSEDNAVKVWDAASGKLLQTLEGHAGYVTSVCYSPCGRTLCSGSNDKTVKVWDVATSGVVTSGTMSTQPTRVVFSPCGRYLLVETVGTPGVVSVADVVTPGAAQPLTFVEVRGALDTAEGVDSVVATLGSNTTVCPQCGVDKANVERLIREMEAMYATIARLQSQCEGEKRKQEEDAEMNEALFGDDS